MGGKIGVNVVNDASMVSYGSNGLPIMVYPKDCVQPTQDALNKLFDMNILGTLWDIDQPPAKATLAHVAIEYWADGAYCYGQQTKEYKHWLLKS